jgi:hypothetical protein
MNSNDSQSIPLQQYHGVPAGWSKDELIAEHRQLGGSWPIDGPDATEPGAPDFLPEEGNCLQEFAEYTKLLKKLNQQNDDS